jgi:hypothetical protein
MSEDRLFKGAQYIGGLWAKGQRCESAGWMAGCSCDHPTEFCKAKALWVRLAGEVKREVDAQSPFGIIEAMSIAEIEAAGVTIMVQFPAGILDVGKKGAMQWSTLRSYMDKPRDLDSVILVLTKFSGSTVVQEADNAGKGAA